MEEDDPRDDEGVISRIFQRPQAEILDAVFAAIAKGFWDAHELREDATPAAPQPAAEARAVH